MKITIGIIAAASILTLQGCVGTIIGATTDAAIAVATVPFKVGGAIVHAATPSKSEQQ